MIDAQNTIRMGNILPLFLQTEANKYLCPYLKGTFKMGCAQSRQTIITQAYALEQIADGRHEKALKVLASIPSDSKEDIDRISQLMITTFQKLAYSNEQVEQFLEIRLKNKQSEKDRARIAFLLANILNKLDLLDKAALWCGKVTQINPKHKQSYILAADILQKLQRYEEIVPLLETGHKNIPQDKQIIQKICSFCESVDHFGKAAEFYQKLIILQPNDYHHYYQYVKNDLQSDNHHIVKSENYLLQGQKLEGKQGYMSFYLNAYLCYRCQMYSQAEKAANSSIKINYLFKPSYYLLQKIYAAADYMDGEKQVLLQVLNLYPNSKRTQSLLASFYWEYEQYDNAAKTVYQILENNDDTQILYTGIVARVFSHTGQSEKAEEYLLSLLKRCKTASQKQAIYSEIIYLHEFNQNWQMAYDFTKIRVRNTENMEYQRIILAKFCLMLNLHDEFLSIVDQLHRKISVLGLDQIIQFMKTLQQAKRYDDCLYIYDTHLIVSKKLLKPQEQALLSIVMANCYFKLGKMDNFMEIIADLQSLVSFVNKWNLYSIGNYMKICNLLWNYERIKHLYEISVAKVNSMQINCYKWGQLRYQEGLNKYREILVKEEQIIASTPQ